jgi:broad specificity phosphatase PhoE
MVSELRWLGVIRHAESVGNQAADSAERSGAEQLDLDTRDPDVTLSARGEQQAMALRTWLKDLPVRPGVLLASPYARTLRTAELATEGLDLHLAFDERLRDRELGVLDLLTAAGVTARFPQEAERRRRLGKFYYRPPGGESWADVALRVRAVLGDLRRDHPDGVVLLVTHDVVVQMIRYVLEDLTEADVVDASREVAIANASVSSWIRADDGRLGPQAFNDVRHLLAEGAPPTHEEGVRREPL